MTDEKIMATIKPDGEYWQPEIETMPREQLRQLQVKKLKETINVCLKSPFYKKRLGEVGVTADSINSLDDLRNGRSWRRWHRWRNRRNGRFYNRLFNYNGLDNLCDRRS